jgi:hypothetical protein
MVFVAPNLASSLNGKYSGWPCTVALLENRNRRIDLPSSFRSNVVVPPTLTSWVSSGNATLSPTAFNPAKWTQLPEFGNLDNTSSSFDASRMSQFRKCPRYIILSDSDPNEVKR